jgi:uncharacterized lipoprotein YmbA
MKAFALLTASAIALAACSSEPEMPSRQPISEITVNTDLSAIGNRQAVDYWTNLSTDLKTALATEFVNDISPDGATLAVDVDELSLANSYTANFGENSTLSGTVTVTDMRGASLGTYNVSATSSQAMANMGAQPGQKVSPNSTEFYQSLVRAFARGVDQAVNTAPAP